MKKYLSLLMLGIIDPFDEYYSGVCSCCCYWKNIHLLMQNQIFLSSNIMEDIDIVQKTPRGVFFSAADLKIINEDGEIGVVGNAYMSTEIDELYMTIYLDRWVE